MSVIAKLKAVLSVDGTKFERGLDKASRRTQSFKKKLSQSLKIAGAAFAAFALVAGAALTAMTKSAFSSIDAQVKLSRSLGITSESFKAMAIVAEEAGVNQDGLGNAIRKSQVAIQNAERGLMTYKRAFDEMNLPVKELKGLSPDEQFEKIAVALAGVEDKTKQVTIAQELFGRQGLGVINMLDDYALKAQDAAAFAEKFGLSVSDVDASKIEEANDAMGRVKMSLGGIGNAIAIEVAPLLTALSNSLLQSGIDGETAGNAVRKGMEVAGVAIDILRRAIAGVQLTYQAFILSVGDLTVKTALILDDLGQTIASTLSKIPGISLEVESSILEIGLSAKKMSEQAKEGFSNTVEELQNFETTSEKIGKIQEDAQKRAEENVFNPNLRESNILIEENIELTKEQKAARKAADDAALRQQEEYISVLKEAQKQQEAYANEGADALFGLARGYTSLRDVAVQALDDILKSMLRVSMGGTSSGGIFGDIGGFLGNIFTGGSTPNAGFNPAISAPPIKPSFSFATGIQKVPFDMDARIHKGEMIVPAQQAKSMDSGGAVTYNIDARGADAGVEQRIRNVMSEVEQLRKDTPKIAVSSVTDANSRNLGFLR